MLAGLLEIYAIALPFGSPPGGSPVSIRCATGAARAASATTYASAAGAARAATRTKTALAARPSDAASDAGAVGAVGPRAGAPMRFLTASRKKGEDSRQ